MPRKRQEASASGSLTSAQGQPRRGSRPRQSCRGPRSSPPPGGREVDATGLDTKQYNSKTAYATHLERKRNEGQPGDPGHPA